MAANLLGKAGIRSVVIEAQQTPYPLPRAVHMDHEMMRIFQTADLIDALLPLVRDAQGHLHIGADGAVLRYLGTAGQARPFGWSNDYFFYQPELEALLRNGLARFPHVSLRLGTEFRSLVQGSEDVVLTLQDKNGPYQIGARHVIACDGASSPVRKALGIALDDLDFEEPWLVVDAEVDGPISFPPIPGLPDNADIQHLSVMLCAPSRPTTIVPGRGNHRRWEFMLLPGEDDEAMRAPAVVKALIAPWVKGTQHQIVRAATYRFHGLVAEQWQSGRVFLAGDAAHQTPPFFGQGMCHGLRDVANLAWKLHLVLSGHASDELFNTYQPEREPQVRSVIAAAVDAGRYICERDPVAAAERDRTIRAKEAIRTIATAADLIVPIGVVVREGDESAGERFIQPPVRMNGSEHRLDDVTGGGFVLLSIKGSSQINLPHNLVDRFHRIGGTVHEIEDHEGILSAWLQQRDAMAVLVRPDFYVYGTARTPADARTLVENLLAKLNLQEAA